MRQKRMDLRQTQWFSGGIDLRNCNWVKPAFFHEPPESTSPAHRNPAWYRRRADVQRVVASSQIRWRKVRGNDRIDKAALSGNHGPRHGKWMGYHHLVCLQGNGLNGFVYLL